MGVRQMELVNKFDNALSGVTGDGGVTGIVVNTGQKYTSGHYWDMRTCAEDVDSEGYGHAHEGEQHDKRQLNLNDDVAQGNADEIDVLAGILIDQYGPLAAPAPVYPAGPHCNARGLTDLGRHLIDGMVDYAQGTRARIPGIVSSHSWANDVVYQRIFDMDGIVAPRTADADRFVNRWAQRRAWHEEHAPPGSFFGLGYGADTNGLGAQPGPRENPAEPVVYDGDGFPAPIGDVTIFQQTDGVRTWDVNTDGVANYGLFADWFRELQLSAEEQLAPDAAQQLTRDMLNGAEDYLRTWERAVYGGGDCVADGSAPRTSTAPPTSRVRPARSR